MLCRVVPHRELWYATIPRRSDSDHMTAVRCAFLLHAHPAMKPPPPVNHYLSPSTAQSHAGKRLPAK